MRKLDDHLPALTEAFRVPPAPLTLDAEFEPQPAHVPLAHYLWILRRQAWKIAAFVVATLLATLIVSLRLTPIYESTVSVDIDRQVPPGVLGEEATRSATNDADQFIATQVKLIESDSVLRPVVDKYRAGRIARNDRVGIFSSVAAATVGETLSRLNAWWVQFSIQQQLQSLQWLQQQSRELEPDVQSTFTPCTGGDPNCSGN